MNKRPKGGGDVWRRERLGMHYVRDESFEERIRDVGRGFFLLSIIKREHRAFGGSRELSGSIIFIREP
jgi:hypothetical protein